MSKKRESQLRTQSNTDAVTIVIEILGSVLPTLHSSQCLQFEARVEKKKCISAYSTGVSLILLPPFDSPVKYFHFCETGFEDKFRR